MYVPRTDGDFSEKMMHDVFLRPFEILQLCSEEFLLVLIGDKEFSLRFCDLVLLSGLIIINIVCIMGMGFRWRLLVIHYFFPGTIWKSFYNCFSRIDIVLQ